MKNHTLLLASSLLLTIFPTHSLHADGATSLSSRSSSASASGSATAAGDRNSITKKSVTVTSDGKRTIKRIVTVRDGVEKVVTETTDENGTTTRSEGDSAPEVANPEPPGPWLGLRVKEASKVLRGQLELADDEGLVVDVLAPNGPAAKAGVVVGDLLLRFGDRPVSTPEELSVVTSDHGIGETVAAVIMRKAKRSTVEIKLEKRPDRRQSAPEGLTDGFEKSQDGAIDISVEGKHRGEALDAVLEDPDVPDSFKETVRRMQERFRDFERRHGAK